jgi:transcriptional regulator GlxA family with amidase domain
MTSLKPKVGRTASSQLREQAAVLLESYRQDGDVDVLLSALEYFSNNGTFFDATKEKLNILFLRMQYQVERSKGQTHDDAVFRVAESVGISARTLGRLFSDKTLPSEIANLQGESELFRYLHKVANARATKPKKS